MPAPSVIKKGITTIIWGSGEPNAFSGAIVESLTITPKNGDPIEIEDNNGFGAIQVLLVDGFNAKVTVVYDNAIAYPVEGANCALNLRVATGNANSNAVPYTCLVASQGQAYARKKEMMIDFNLTYRPGIDV